jgi:hypothetical protein
MAWISGDGSIAFDQVVTTGLTAHSNAGGRVVGFALKRVGELLLPHLGARQCGPYKNQRRAVVRPYKNQRGDQETNG